MKLFLAGLGLAAVLPMLGLVAQERFPTVRTSARNPAASYKADTVTLDGETVRLTGKVEITTDTIILKADAAEYHPQTGEIEAHGDVSVKPIPVFTRGMSQFGVK